MKVLVVDDDEVQLNRLANGLREQGVEVVEALNGVEALKCLDSETDIKWVLRKRIQN